MASYTQWRRHADAGEVRRVTWICGDQRVLVEEVVDHIRATLAPCDLDYVSHTAGHTADRDIWAAAHQYPIDTTANRLVLIRHAERIRTWDPLTGWLASTRTLPNVHLVFVADEPDFPHLHTGGKRGPLSPHLEAIKQRGHIVRCTMPNEDDAVTWVRQRAVLDDESARHLLTRTGGNLDQAAAVCAKISLFVGQARPATINQLCAEIPSESFVESLLLLHKPSALLTAETLRDTEYGKILGLLDSRLDLMGALWRAVRSGHRTREIQNLPRFLVRQFTPVAKHYDPPRCLYSRRLLAVIDDAYQNGARDALLQSLVALW